MRLIDKKKIYKIRVKAIDLRRHPSPLLNSKIEYLRERVDWRMSGLGNARVECMGRGIRDNQTRLDWVIILTLLIKNNIYMGFPWEY